MEMEKFCSGVVVLDRMVSSVMQAVVLQTALVAEKSLVRLLVAGSLKKSIFMLYCFWKLGFSTVTRTVSALGRSCFYG
ncbi:hypothetical protein BVC80_931g9 [Macleaya cordata]|uniref:Uncharacterized protein n=1 Tax=Macleaya cordata TaxID=56857 RepID=A0A200QAF0_MACCD|nr:hypothetical protein BVC80_931g9 [Macleaya cordata]